MKKINFGFCVGFINFSLAIVGCSGGDLHHSVPASIEDIATIVQQDDGSFLVQCKNSREAYSINRDQLAEEIAANTICDIVPATFYVGTYQGDSGGLLKSQAVIDYYHDNVSNRTSSDLATMRMTVVICLGNTPFSRRTLLAKSVDDENHTILFGNENPNGYDLFVTHETDWNSWTGNFIDPEGTSGVDPQLKMAARPDLVGRVCDWN